MPAAGQKEEEPTGWEEPSPESVRRRMEIDDGTAAWGDPGKYLDIGSFQSAISRLDIRIYGNTPPS